MAHEPRRPPPTTPAEIEEQRREIAELERRRKLLTATALVCEKRIQVTVNADGVLIETKFAADICDLSYDEVAEAIPIAVRAAATEVLRKGRALTWSLLDRDTDVAVTAGELGAVGPAAAIPLIPTRAPGGPGERRTTS
ncbi:hypothetical protein ACWDSJ_24795 [Nocardia sp. NPDC003482]|uniref:hypothetical protein n=1 Tax=Nocardia sp. NPDC004068 TaxID=3364303 RepID=UPI0036D12AA0